MNPSIQQQNTNFENRLAHQLVGKTEFLYPLKMNGLLQFPETRLVQYDCGNSFFFMGKFKLLFIFLALKALKGCKQLYDQKAEKCTIMI